MQELVLWSDITNTSQIGYIMDRAVRIGMGDLDDLKKVLRTGWNPTLAIVCEIPTEQESRLIGGKPAVAVTGYRRLAAIQEMGIQMPGIIVYRPESGRFTDAERLEIQLEHNRCQGYVPLDLYTSVRHHFPEWDVCIRHNSVYVTVKVNEYHIYREDSGLLRISRAWDAGFGFSECLMVSTTVREEDLIPVLSAMIELHR